MKMLMKKLFGKINGRSVERPKEVEHSVKYVNLHGRMRFLNKIALVTGGSGSIGRAICIRLAAEGASVIVCGRDQGKIVAVVNEIHTTGGTAVPYVMDVMEEQSIDQACCSVAESFGHLDILVNCAGYSARSEKAFLHEQKTQTIDELLGVNLRGTILCSRSAAKQMVAQRHGKIINIASITGLQGKAKHAEYAAAKAGVIALTKSQAIELGEYGVNVNCVSPGLIPREDADNDKLLSFMQTNFLGRNGIPEDIAGAVAFLASEDASFITGQNLIVDGGRSLGLTGDSKNVRTG